MQWAMNKACPATTADGARYVDHILGRDDDAHGGAAGGCAYRTISYALEHAPSDIYLAHGNYPRNVHEDDKPLYLTGNQVLHGDATDRTAVVLNPHASIGWGNSIHFVGARNGVDHCTFDGPSSLGIVAIQVNSHPASTASPHFIVDNVFRAMSTHVAVFQGDVRIEKNVFRETINTAIQWDEASTTSQLIDNDFIGNGADIYCTSSSGSPGLVGHGNKAGGGGAIRCLACTSCPFL